MLFRICTLTLVFGLFWSIQAGALVLLEDDFDTENGGSGALNFTGLTNWNVIDGAIDLIGNGYYDLYPGNGLYLDLDGSSSKAGTLESKVVFSLDPGDYELRFDLGGSARTASPVDTVTVSLGSVFSESFTLEYDDPLTTIVRNISVATASTGTLVFAHDGADYRGIILDDVRLTRLDASSVPEPSVLLITFAGLCVLWAVWRRGIGTVR